MNKTMLSETDAYALLKKHKVPVPENRITDGVENAVSTADEIGYPVVMKIVSPQVVHKSDAGGVIVGIAGAGEVKKAYEEINRRVREKFPEADIQGIVVEKQMPPGLELIIGGKTDPSFGKIITFGIGGTLVELLKMVTIKVLPLNSHEITQMVREFKGYPLIRGYRDHPPRDEERLIQTLEAIGAWFYQDKKAVEFDINPLLLYEKGVCAVDARIYMGDESGMAPRKKKKKSVSPEIFYPQSIAVVGASANPGKVGYAVLRNLLDFPGKLYPINPKSGEVMGHKAYLSLTAVKESIDLAVICVPAKIVPEVMEQAGEKEVKLAVVISAGFREIGEKGRALEEKVLQSAEKSHIRIIGPNCLGIILPYKKINATFDPANPKPGHLAFISQSGAVITTVVDWCIQEGVGLSAVISVGNQADMGFDELLTFTGHDRDTKAAILYIEEIKEGRSFMEAVKETVKIKHVIAVKSGASEKGRKAASSHTGSLAGSYQVYQAMFKQAGVISAYSLKEAFQIGELLASEDYPRGKRSLIITNAGGFAVLASDYAEKYGLELTALPEAMVSEMNTFLSEEWSRENPMDLVGDAKVERYAKVFDLMMKNQDIWDIAFVVAVPTTSLDPRGLAREVVRFSRNTDNMIVGCLLGGHSMKGGVSILRESSIPNFSELEEAFRAVGKALGWDSE